MPQEKLAGLMARFNLNMKQCAKLLGVPYNHFRDLYHERRPLKKYHERSISAHNKLTQEQIEVALNGKAKREV